METWISRRCRIDGWQQFATGVAIAVPAIVVLAVDRELYEFSHPHRDALTVGVELIACVGAAIVGASMAWRASMWIRDPATHPAAACAASWGDPPAVSSQIEVELKDPPARTAGIDATESYFIDRRWMRFKVHRWEDLAWAYVRTTRRSVNLIPVGSEHAAVLKFRTGSGEFNASERVVKRVLLHAQTRAPWAIHGYSREVETRFRKDRASFFAEVARRRADGSQVG